MLSQIGIILILIAFVVYAYMVGAFLFWAALLGIKKDDEDIIGLIWVYIKAGFWWPIQEIIDKVSKGELD